MEARTKKLIGLGALIIALLSIALSGDDVDEIVAQERAKAASKVNSKTNALGSNGQCEDVLRIVAPDANELLYATRLLEGAVDKKYAAATVTLQKQRDLAITQSEIWKYKAEAAKSQEEHARATRNLNALENGMDGLRVDSATTYVKGQTTQSDDLETAEQSIDSDYRVQLRLRGVGDDGSMLFTKGDSWYRNVRVGQYIGNVEITSFDPQLECVSLAIDGKPLKQKLCTN